jgi:hypothetical protein
LQSRDRPADLVLAATVATLRRPAPGSGAAGELAPLEGPDDRPCPGEVLPEFLDQLFQGGALLAGEPPIDAATPPALLPADFDRAGGVGLPAWARPARVPDHDTNLAALVVEVSRPDPVPVLRAGEADPLPGQGAEPVGAVLATGVAAAWLAAALHAPDRKRRAGNYT